MPWKGPSSLLSSLPITNSGSSWTLARVIKGTENRGPHGAIWMESIQAVLTHTGLWGFHGNGHMFECVACGRSVPDSLAWPGIDIWSCAISFVSICMCSSMNKSPLFHVKGKGSDALSQHPKFWSHGILQQKVWIPNLKSWSLWRQRRMNLVSQTLALLWQIRNCCSGLFLRTGLLALGRFRGPWDEKRSSGACPSWFCSKESGPGGSRYQRHTLF